jgi:PAS domain S-box-containing protein
MRARLAVGIFVLIGLAAAYLVSEAYLDRDSALAAAVEQARTAAASVPEVAHQIRDSARLLLELLSQIPEVQSADPSRCNASLARVLKSQPRYNNLIVVGLDGTVLCSGIPLAKPINVADRQWFQEVTKTRHFEEGGFVVGRGTGKAQRAYAYSFVDTASGSTRIVAALLDLLWFSNALRGVPLPANSSYGIIDGSGRQLARFPDPERYIGHDVRDSPMYRQLLAHQDGGAFRVAGIDGIERLYFAIAPSADLSHLTSDYAYVGIPTTAIFAGTQAELRNRLLGLGILGALLLIGSYLVSESYILRPLNALVALSRRIASGDLTARSDLRIAPAEFRTLADSFDSMAASLAARAALLDQEILQHRQTEERLRASEERFRSFTDIAAHWHWELDARLRVSGVSEKYDSVSGLRLARIRGRTMWEIAGDSDPPASPLWGELRARLMAQEAFRDFRYSVAVEGGQIRYRRVSGAPIFDEQGRFGGYRCVSNDETAEVEATLRARAAEELLSHAVESIPDGFAIYDPSDKLVMMNSQYRKLLFPEIAEGAIGRTFEELIRSHLRAGYYPDAVGREEEFLQERLAAHRQPDKAHLYRDSRGVWILARDHLMADGTIVAIRTDVTELEMIDEALRESQASLLQAQQVAKMGSWEIDLANMNQAGDKSLRWSDETFRIFGYKPGEIEVTNDVFFRAVHPDDRERVREAAAKAISTGEDYDLEHRIIRPDGREAIVRERSKILRAPSSGKPVKMVGIVQDVTESRETTDRLTRSQVLLTEMERIAGIGGWDLELATGDMSCTEGLKSIYGLTHADLPLRVGVLLKYVHPDDRARVRSEFNSAPLLERPYSSQFRIARSDGKERMIIERGDFVRDEQGQPIRMVGATMDITERWLAEEQLRQQQKLEAIGQLTGGIAHDFNNLLTIIIGNLELINERPDAKVGDKLSLVQMALQSALRGSELVNRLLAIARQQPLQAEVVEVNRLIESLSPLLHRSLGERVTIETALAANLWPVLTDPHQLENALLNLAINARDAMAGGGTLTIRTENVRLEADRAPKLPDLLPGEYVMLSVGDTGSGMPPEIQARAVEPFFTTKDVGKGSGLGLAMVHGFVKQCGGHLLIYSEVGHGTTVKLYLPRVQGTLGAREMADEPTGIPHGSERILLVEDDAMVRETATLMLQDLGYSVIEAVDGPSAEMALASGSPVDLLFTDVAMPGGMSGWDLVQAVWQKRPNMRVLFATGYADNPILRDARLDDRIQVLSKPYNKGDLALQLRRALDKVA